MAKACQCRGPISGSASLRAKSFKGAKTWCTAWRQRGTTRWTMYEDYGKRWETGGKYKKNTGHTSENIWKILETYGKIIGKQGKYLRNNMKNMGNIWETMENLWETRGKICEKTWENIWTYGPGHPLNPAQWLRPCWDDPWRLNMSCHI